MTLPTEATADELAKLLGLTSRRVRGLAEEGVVKKTGRGRYDLATSVRAYVTMLADHETDAASAARSRLLEARASDLEQRVAHRRGDVMTVKEAEALIVNFVMIAQADMLSLPRRTTRDPALTQKIAEEVDAMMNRMADKMEKLAALMAAGAEIDVEKLIEGGQ